MGKGKLFVISGASGVGKSTVLGKVMAQREDLLFSVSATTRAPRPGEKEAVSYYFVSKDAFMDMIEKNAFIEYDAHMGNYYGTPVDQLEEKLGRGNVILDIEPNGAFNVRKVRPDAVLIFIAPPSMEELERRLRGRGTETEDKVLKRLETARGELAYADRYKHQIINGGDLEAAYQELRSIYLKETHQD